MDTPALAEAATIKNGIVIAQVNELVEREADLPRVNIPGSWGDFVVPADKPFFIEPQFTRDPRLIKPVHILMAMMAITCIYAEHQVQSLNHGIGFNIVAIAVVADLRRTAQSERENLQELDAESASAPDSRHRIGLGRNCPLLRR